MNSRAGHTDPGLEPAAHRGSGGPGGVCSPDAGGGCRWRRVALSSCAVLPGVLSCRLNVKVFGSRPFSHGFRLTHTGREHVLCREV